MFGEPKTSSTNDPTTVPTPRATTMSKAGSATASNRSATRVATAPHSARFHPRLSHGTATITTAVVEASTSEVG